MEGGCARQAGVATLNLGFVLVTARHRAPVRALLIYPGTSIVKALLETFGILDPASFADAALALLLILVGISLMRPWRASQPER